MKTTLKKNKQKPTQQVKFNEYLLEGKERYRIKKILTEMEEYKINKKEQTKEKKQKPTKLNDDFKKDIEGFLFSNITLAIGSAMVVYASLKNNIATDFLGILGLGTIPFSLAGIITFGVAILNKIKNRGILE